MTPDEHMRMARGYTAEIMEGERKDKEMQALVDLATMHYLGYLAEVEWSKDWTNDGKQL
jgi:hypothetical protein